MIVFVVEAGKEHGIGHLKRSLQLASLLKQDTLILIETGGDSISSLEPLLLKQEHQFITSRDNPEKLVESSAVELLIQDRRHLSQKWSEFCHTHSIPQIALDGYGLPAAEIEVLINPLFHHGPKHANFDTLAYQYIDTSSLKRPRKIAHFDVLVSLGGSDPAQGARLIVQDLVKMGLNVCLIQGPLSEYSWADSMEGLSLIQNPKSLLPYIEHSDVVITSVGLTLIEALSLQKKCILFSPTLYHDTIARHCNYAINGGLLAYFQPGALRSLLNKEPEVNTIQVLPDYKKWWNQLITRIQAKGAPHCPLCSSQKRHSMWRNEHSTLFECLDCGSNYLYSYAGDRQEYQADYFQGHYKSVYGRDYFDDEKQIRAFSRRRLAIISDYHPHRGNDRLLDFGSAYGVFCDEARTLGYMVQGVEISEYARQRSQELFHIHTDPQWPPAGDSWDVISAWFTLEHISEPRQWLKDANIRLNKNGILALGLPHARGALARWNKSLYRELRPAEHEFEPSLPGLRNALNSAGFHIERVEYFGLHPDRIGWPDRPFIRNIQKTFGLGDTFEVYARKISSPR